MPEINKLLCRATIVLTFLHFFLSFLTRKSWKFHILPENVEVDREKNVFERWWVIVLLGPQWDYSTIGWYIIRIQFTGGTIFTNLEKKK